LEGTVRPIRRPKDPARQEDWYSGRKKRRTVKNLILTEQRAVKFLSPTAPGRQTDNRLAESLEQVLFPRPVSHQTDNNREALDPIIVLKFGCMINY